MTSQLRVLGGLALALAGLVLAAVQVSAQPTASVSLNPSPIEVRTGGTATAEVRVQDLRHAIYDDGVYYQGLGGFELELVFDPTRVRVVRAQGEDFLGNTGRSVSCFDRRDAPETFAFACVTGSENSAGAEGSGALARVTFRSVRAGSSDVDMQVKLFDPLGNRILSSTITTTVNASGSAPENVQPPSSNEGSGGSGGGSGGGGSGSNSSGGSTDGGRTPDSALRGTSGGGATGGAAGGASGGGTGSGPASGSTQGGGAAGAGAGSAGPAGGGAGTGSGSVGSGFPRAGYGPPERGGSPFPPLAAGLALAGAALFGGGLWLTRSHSTPNREGP